MSSRRDVGLVVLLGTFLFAFNAIAQQQKTPYPPRPAGDAAKPVMEKIAKAKADIAKAQSTANQAAAKIREQFEAGPEWQAASAAQKKAQTESDAARKRVLDSVHDSAAYQQALATKKTHESELETAKAGGNSSDITAAATKVMETGSTLSKLEADALAADAKFVQAKKALLDANTKLAAMTKQSDDLVKADAGWQAAKKEIDAAEQARVPLDKELAAAQAQDVQALKQWQQQCSQIDQQNRDRAVQEAQQRRNQNNNNNNRRG